MYNKNKGNFNFIVYKQRNRQYSHRTPPYAILQDKYEELTNKFDKFVCNTKTCPYKSIR